MQNLEEAIINEDKIRVEDILLTDPSAIDACDVDGIPLPFLAAKIGSTGIVRYIVEYSRTSMNMTDEKNRNILHYAAMSGNTDLCRYLVERVGMDVCSGDGERITPYEIACRMGHAELRAYFEEAIGAPGNALYQNPIRTGMFPDPSILRTGEDYYMVNSSFIYFPCIPISHSKDLIHWEIVGYAIDNPDWSGLKTLEGGRGYWAPDISCDNGTYYITATYRLNDGGKVYRKQMVVTASRPEGPYGKPVYLDEDGIDPSLFHEGGRHYMLLNRGARIFEISADGREQLSGAKLLYYGAQKRASEGPHLLKKDGYYYLFLAEGGTGMGHRISVARSGTLMGKYEPCPYNPIMRQTDARGAIQRAGHGKPVCTQNGEWYMVYLCGRMIDGAYSMLGRETALDPITWTADGWPIVNSLKGPSVLQKKPDLPGYTPETNDDFTGGALSPAWMTPREPDSDGIRTAGGKLYIKGSTRPLSEMGARNILLRRQCDFAFTVDACMTVPDLLEGQEAGLTCYYDENTWLTFGLIRTDGELRLAVKEHCGERDTCHLAAKERCGEDACHPADTAGSGYVRIGKEQIGSPIRLRIRTDRLKRSFDCGPDADHLRQVLSLDHIYYLCDEGLQKGKRFTGAMVGMYAYAGREPFEAEFTSFIYRAGQAQGL